MLAILENNFKLTNRRAVSQILGSVFMLAIVAAFGSIVLFSGIKGINDFRSAIDIFSTDTSIAVQETIKIDHIRFDPDDSNKNVTVWIRNTGTVDVTIDRITLIKFDTQDLIIKESVFDQTIFQEEVKKISFIDSQVSLPSPCSVWDCKISNKHLKDSEYRVILTTSRGSEVEGTFSPYNG